MSAAKKPSAWTHRSEVRKKSLEERKRLRARVPRGRPTRAALTASIVKEESVSARVRREKALSQLRLGAVVRVHVHHGEPVEGVVRRLDNYRVLIATHEFTQAVPISKIDRVEVHS